MVSANFPVGSELSLTVRSISTETSLTAVCEDPRADGANVLFRFTAAAYTTRGYSFGLIWAAPPSRARCAVTSLLALSLSLKCIPPGWRQSQSACREIAIRRRSGHLSEPCSDIRRFGSRSLSVVSLIDPSLDRIMHLPLKLQTEPTPAWAVRESAISLLPWTICRIPLVRRGWKSA
jgi:hypothetical protein